MVIVATVLIMGQSIKGQSGSQIKIGIVGPFTGPAATFGDFMQRGLDFALSELTPEDRARIQIVKEDDRCKGADGASVVQKLVAVEKVNYVIGPLCNEATLATEALFEDNKVISISIGLPSNDIANMGPYHFSFSPEIEYMMKAITSEMSKQNLKRVAVIHMNGPFENENYKHFLTHYKAPGGEIVADESLAKGTTDFRSAILKIKQSNPDSLMVIAHTGELNNILKQLEEQKLNVLPKFGIHAAESPVLAQNIKLAEGLIYGYPGDKTQNESARIYAEKYKAQYNADPDPSSTNVYDSFKILHAAIQECGNENKACVQKKLAGLKDYQGANGSLSVDERGVGTYKEIMLKTVRGGRFERL